MPLQTAGLIAKVGFYLGCAAGLSLAVAELAGPDLPRPYEGLAILAVVLLILGFGGGALGVWLALRQDQIIDRQAQLEALVGQQLASAYVAGVSARPDEPVVRMHGRSR